jgi:hypothetical protein
MSQSEFLLYSWFRNLPPAFATVIKNHNQGSILGTRLQNKVSCVGLVNHNR